MANLSDLIAQSTSDNPQKLVNLALATQMMGSGSGCSGSGLGGTNYIFVKGDGTPEENAIELQEAYDTAKTMPRYRGLLSGINTFYIDQTFESSENNLFYRVISNYTGDVSKYIFFAVQVTEEEAKSVHTTVVVAPGEYKFYDMSMSFNMDDCGINVVSLTGLPDVIIDNLSVGSQCRYSHFRGLKCKIGFHVEASAYPDMIFENCQGGNNSFGKSNDYENRPDAGGIYINCVGGDDSFGYTSTGKFYNCKAGDDSYGSDNEASGEFYNCTGGEGAFAGNEGVASGKFYNCKGGKFSFGGNGQVSGEFYNCIGDKRSFGGDEGIISGRLYYCKLTEGEYEANKWGKLVLCIDGNDTVVTTP
jgi:hypothetical protein